MDLRMGTPSFRSDRRGAVWSLYDWNGRPAFVSSFEAGTRSFFHIDSRLLCILLPVEFGLTL